MLIIETGSSDAGLHLYQSGVGLVAHHVGYADNVSGYNKGVHAISGEAGLVAQHVYGNGLHIYNTSLRYQINLIDTYPQWSHGAVSGLAFSSDGQYLFVLDNEADAIVQLSTTDWSVVATIPIGFDLTMSSETYDNRLLVGSDIRYFTILTDTGFVQVDNPSVSSTISGTSAADDISGTGLFDEILGLGGDDQIHAGNGNDILDGGAGNDSLDGGAGTDTASYATAASRVVVSLAVSGAQNTSGAGSDTLTSIENLTGSAYNDRLTGNTAANMLVGLAGGDTLLGGAGDDTLDGGDGLDWLYGGSGNDTLLGGLGNDRLDGRTGGDALIGGAGNDIYFVDNAGDVIAENSGEGTDWVRSSISWTLGANVERLQLIGTGPINGTGNELDNILVGNSEANVLAGLAGNDFFKGAAGNDTLDGGAGNDRLDGGTGDDSLAGGLGNDFYYVDSPGDTVTENSGEGSDWVLSSISWTLGANVENLQLTGSVSTNGTGNELDNTSSAVRDQTSLPALPVTTLLRAVPATTRSLAAPAAMCFTAKGVQTRSCFATATSPA